MVTGSSRNARTPSSAVTNQKVGDIIDFGSEERREERRRDAEHGRGGGGATLSHANWQRVFLRSKRPSARVLREFQL
jgi:hypothetical protein